MIIIAQWVKEAGCNEWGGKELQQKNGTTKKKKLEVKNVSEMKNLLDEIKSWLDTTEEWIQN